MVRMARVFGVLLVALAVAGGIFAQGASANDGATVYVHLRGCYTGAQNVYDDCHDIVGVGYTLQLGPLTPQTTDASGDVAWYGVPAGSWSLVALDADLAAMPVLGSYCSLEEDLGTETYIDTTGGYLPVYDGDVIYCDIYVYLGDAPSDGSSDGGSSDGGTTMPDTGVGAAGGNGLLPLALTGAVAAAGFAVASRRRAVR